MRQHILKTSFAAFALTLTLGACTTDGMQTAKAVDKNLQQKQPVTKPLPALVVTNAAVPEVIYRKGSRDTIFSNDMPEMVRERSANQPIETLVTRKVNELSRDLTKLSRNTDDAKERLATLQQKNDLAASKYYDVVAAINTELQAGTTPGNPILVERWNVAQDRLQDLSSSTGALNDLATDLTDQASRAAFLQDNIRAAYALSGAIKEDHVKLRALEDDVNQNIVGINRQLTAVSDELNRRSSYMRSETLNLQTMSLSIARGELYGQNLTNTLYKRAAAEGEDFFNAGQAGNLSKEETVAPVNNRRPLVIIRFDHPNVNYEQALYSAVGQALEKYPSAKFDLLALSSSNGNTAQSALASNEARKNGEAVLRSLSQMGLPIERVNLSAASSKDVRNSEVRIFIQ